MSAAFCGCDEEAGWMCKIHTEIELDIEDCYMAPVLPLRSVVLPSDPKLKDTNPKEAIGSDKIPFHLWPETATILGALGLLDGTLKYGRSNFRVAGVKASVYYDAARRHLNKWFEGEEADPDSGLPHLSHLLACIAIIVDAQAAGRLTDDRMVAGGYTPMLNDLTPHVKRLKALHAEKAPKHFTIEDSE